MTLVLAQAQSEAFTAQDWVPPLIAVAGTLVGALGGSYITWRIERSRRADAAASRWTSDRRQLYSEYLTTMRSLTLDVEAVVRERQRRGGLIRPTLLIEVLFRRRQLLGGLESVGRLTSDIRLLASPEVGAVAEEIFALFREVGEMARHRRPHAVVQDVLDSNDEKWHDVTERFLAAAQRDLGTRLEPT